MKQKLTSLTPYLLLGCIGLFLLTWKIGTYPLYWYDEGSRTNLSRTFLETGNYSTYSSDGFQPFDAWVTANPLDVLFTSAAMLFFGKNVVALRLALIPFTLGGMLLIVHLAVRLFGKPIGWVAALTVFAAPPMIGSGYLLIGRQNLSENTSFFMLILSLLMWFHSWDTRKMRWSWLGGLLLGLGLISNFQVMLWVFPSFVVIWFGRSVQNRKRSWGEISFIFSAVLVILGWYGLTLLLMPAPIRELNMTTLIDSINQQLFSGLSGKIVTTSSLVMFFVMIITSLATIMNLFQIPWKQWLSNSDHWKLATLGTSILFCAFWYFFFSIGWPRYAYAGWIITLMLLGWWGFRVTSKIVNYMSSNYQQLQDKLHWVMITCLIGVTVSAYGIPLLNVEKAIPAQNLADFIDSEISQDALIETTEMEIFGISNHWEFHYPSYEYILDATKQIYFEGRSPQIPYNPVSENPDYLITGPLSDWIGLYWNSGIMEYEFKKIAEFPPYQVFIRVRHELKLVY